MSSVSLDGAASKHKQGRLRSACTLVQAALSIPCLHKKICRSF